MDPLPWNQIAAPVVACLLLFVVAGAGYTRFRFAALGLIAVVTYGILQDQVSARLCPEYFTALHKPIPDLKDPTLLGVAWGFLGSWWGGVLTGYCAGLFATLGKRPKLSPREIILPLAAIMLGVATIVAITGFSVWRHSEMFGVKLEPGLSSMVPPEHHQPLLIVACYHFVAYAASIAGGITLCVWIWRERNKRRKTLANIPQSTLPQVNVSA
jgi:hypothetical protein